MRYFLALWFLGAGLCAPAMAMAQESVAETEPSQPPEQKENEKADTPTQEDNPAAQEEFAPKEFDAEEYF